MTNVTRSASCFGTQPADGAFLSVMARVLRTLRFTSLDKRPARRPRDDGRRAGSVGSFFPEKNDATLDGRVRSVAAEAAPTNSDHSSTGWNWLRQVGDQLFRLAQVGTAEDIQVIQHMVKLVQL